MATMRFSVTLPKADRVHHINEDDVLVVLSRLPTEFQAQLRAVHFNDRSWGGRCLGYVNQGRREIGLCALPPRISLSRFIVKGYGSPPEFGAIRGRQRPALAIRRFMLYDVFLHELGHLQIIDAAAKSPRRRFAMERCAEDFALRWRRELWSRHFVHADAVHNPPDAQESARWNQ
jgi:hypothetical protein